MWAYLLRQVRGHVGGAACRLPARSIEASLEELFDIQHRAGHCDFVLVEECELLQALLRPVHERLVAHDGRGEELLLHELVPHDGPQLLDSEIGHQGLDAALTSEVKLCSET